MGTLYSRFRKPTQDEEPVKTKILLDPPNDQKYVYPDLTQVSKFGKWCGPFAHERNSYHCQHLDRIAFYHANYAKYGHFRWFQEATKDHSTDREWELLYHGKHVMEGEHPAVIANALQELVEWNIKLKEESVNREMEALKKIQEANSTKSEQNETPNDVPEIQPEEGEISG